MPRKLLVSLVLGAVVLALMLALPWPGATGDRGHRNHVGRIFFWAGLVLAMPWPGQVIRRAATGLALAALLASFADALDATRELASPWGPLRLTRGALGVGVALLFLWAQRQTDVLLWSSKWSAARDGRP